MTKKRIIEFLKGICEVVEVLERDLAEGEVPHAEVSTAIHVFIDDLLDEEERENG